MRRLLCDPEVAIGRSERHLLRCLDQLDRIDAILDAPVSICPDELAIELLRRAKRILPE